MKLIKHLKSPKPVTMVLQHDPLIIWLSPIHELHIERGDPLAKVATKVAKLLSMTEEDARRIVGLYYALGERRAANNPSREWTEKELRCTPKRRYLKNPS